MDDNQGTVLRVINPTHMFWKDKTGRSHSVQLVEVERMVGGLVQAESYSQLTVGAIVNVNWRYNRAGEKVWTARKN